MLKSVLVRRLFRRSGPVALLLVLCSAVLAVAASLTMFTAAYEGTRVRVDWEVSTEADVTGFDLSRKSAIESSYSSVATVVPNGQRRYQYYDANVFRTAPGGTAGTPAPSAGGPFTYRLTVHSPNGDQSYLTVLAGTPSAVQRSWGTIKSMFR